MENLELLQWVTGLSAVVALIVGVVQLHRWFSRDRDKRTRAVSRGSAIRSGSGHGSAYRLGPGEGDAIRSGSGHGSAHRVDPEGGDAIRIAAASAYPKKTKALEALDRLQSSVQSRGVALSEWEQEVRAERRESGRRALRNDQ